MSIIIIMVMICWYVIGCWCKKNLNVYSLPINRIHCSEVRYLRKFFFCVA